MTIVRAELLKGAEAVDGSVVTVSSGELSRAASRGNALMVAIGVSVTRAAAIVVSVTRAAAIAIVLSEQITSTRPQVIL